MVDFIIQKKAGICMNIKQFFPAKHGEAVLEMLNSFIDYTPMAKKQDTAADAQFMFRDGHIQEAGRYLEYVMLAEDGKAIGFFSVNPNGSGQVWRIDEMFVAANADVNEVVKPMLEQIYMLAEAGGIEKILVFAYPTFGDIINYWESLGFQKAPLIKMLNVDNERLMAFAKSI